MIRRFMTLLTALTVLALSPAAAQTIPKLTGPVMDLANQLDPGQEAALDAKLRADQSSTQQQFVVVYAKGASSSAAHAAIAFAGGTILKENRRHE